MTRKIEREFFLRIEQFEDMKDEKYGPWLYTEIEVKNSKERDKYVSVKLIVPIAEKKIEISESEFHESFIGHCFSKEDWAVVERVKEKLFGGES